MRPSPRNIEGGGEFRLQRSSCRVIQRLPLLLPPLYSEPAVLDDVAQLAARANSSFCHASARQGLCGMSMWPLTLVRPGRQPLGRSVPPRLYLVAWSL